MNARQALNRMGAGGHTSPTETREVPVAGDLLPPVQLPACCPGCGVVLDPPVLGMNAYVCACGYHFRLTADAWIALLADRLTWSEEWTDLEATDVPEWQHPVPYRSALDAAESSGLREAVRAGSCTLAGRRIWLAVFDFRHMGGTLGTVAGERVARAAESAAASGEPLVVVTASGGARMQEGPAALMQMAKVNAAIADLQDAGGVYVCVLTDPTYGGTAASLAFVADVTMAEPGAAIGFTGPRVIAQSIAVRLPDGFQTSEFQFEHGQIDMLVPRTELRRTLASLLGLLS